MRPWYFFILLLLIPGRMLSQGTSLYILGTAQDGGYPHMGCKRTCCTRAWQNDSLKQYVVSLALVDSASRQWWLFEATPDIKYQLQEFNKSTKGYYPYLPAGIFLTHAHMGHYTGLAELGREVMSTKEIPVYVLPRFKTFLENNGPWSQLVKLKNIVIQSLKEDSSVAVTSTIRVEAFAVPHRDEYSETAGFRMITAGKKYLFIPDIDKWQKWSRNILEEVQKTDLAFIDATFYDPTELPGRSMAEVPHPLVKETMELFAGQDEKTKAKVHFIHLNHTNPLLWDQATRAGFAKTGFNLAKQGAHY